MLIEGSEWFSVDHPQIGHYFKDVFENYKNWKVKGKQQGYYSRSNFSFSRMVKQLDDILTNYLPSLPTSIKTQLPKLDLKSPSKSPSLQLPKLKKI
jgi:hypothetical protein